MSHNSFSKFLCNPDPGFLQELNGQFPSGKDVNKVILKDYIAAVSAVGQSDCFVLNRDNVCLKHYRKLPGVNGVVQQNAVHWFYTAEGLISV